MLKPKADYVLLSYGSAFCDRPFFFSQ